jgi:flagellar basal body-associated protein FliL
MQKNQKKGKTKSISIFQVIIIIVFVVIIAISIIRIVKDKKENSDNKNANENNVESYVEEIQTGVKINKSTKLNEAKQVDGLNVSNIQLTTSNGMTTLLAEVTNDTEAASNLKVVEISLLNQKGEVLNTATGIINELKPGEKTELNVTLTSDFVNAYDFTINVK